MKKIFKKKNATPVTETPPLPVTRKYITLGSTVVKLKVFYSTPDNNYLDSYEHNFVIPLQLNENTASKIVDLAMNCEIFEFNAMLGYKEVNRTIQEMREGYRWVDGERRMFKIEVGNISINDFE